MLLILNYITLRWATTINKFTRYMNATFPDYVCKSRLSYEILCQGSATLLDEPLYEATAWPAENNYVVRGNFISCVNSNFLLLREREFFNVFPVMQKLATSCGRVPVPTFFWKTRTGISPIKFNFANWTYSNAILNEQCAFYNKHGDADIYQNARRVYRNTRLVYYTTTQVAIKWPFCGNCCVSSLLATQTHVYMTTHRSGSSCAQWGFCNKLCAWIERKRAQDARDYRLNMRHPMGWRAFKCKAAKILKFGFLILGIIYICVFPAHTYMLWFKILHAGTSWMFEYSAVFLWSAGADVVLWLLWWLRNAKVALWYESLTSAPILLHALFVACGLITLMCEVFVFIVCLTYAVTPALLSLSLWVIGLIYIACKFILLNWGCKNEADLRYVDERISFWWPFALAVALAICILVLGGFLMIAGSHFVLYVHNMPCLFMYFTGLPQGLFMLHPWLLA